MKKLLSSLTLTLLMGVMALSALAQEDTVERPVTEKLLPETTVVFMQFDNIREMFEKSRDTGFGRMLEHPEVESLWNGAIEEARNAYETVKENVGLELDDFQNFPTGEITFAVIAPKRADLQFALMLEVDEESEAFQNVFNRGRELIETEGEEIEAEETDDVTFESFTADGNRFTTFVKDGLFVSANSQELAQQVVDRWMNREVEKIRPLTENRKFATVMNRCRGTKDTPPDMRFYVDPIELARGATRGNMGAQAVINFLPILGLDGLSAIGGSAIYDELGFESVGHMHVLLANPRAGIVKMLALRPGEYKPESWVPESVNTYVSTSWDLNQAFAELEKIVDTFQGEGAFSDGIEENINQELDLDFKEDILDQLTGRVTFTQWIDFPATFTSQVQVFSAELADLEKFEALREKLFARLEEEGELEEISEVEYKGVVYWTENQENVEERRQRRRERIRERSEEIEGPVFDPEAPQPCIGVIGNSLVFCTNPKFMERAIDTERGEAPALLDNEEFSETTETIVKLLRNDMPGAIFYQQPAAGMEMMFDLAKGDDIQGFFNMIQDEEDEANEILGRFRTVLEENQLPDFEEVRGFFAPAGGFITNDDTGYHLMTFQLKHDREKK